MLVDYHTSTRIGSMDLADSTFFSLDEVFESGCDEVGQFVTSNRFEITCSQGLDSYRFKADFVNREQATRAFLWIISHAMKGRSPVGSEKWIKL